MEIPAVLYGLWRNVKPRVKRSVDKIVKGASWHEAFQRSGMLSTDDTPGLLVLEGPGPLAGGAPHFQLFAPWRFLLSHHRELSAERIDELFIASLQDPWGIMSLISYSAEWIFTMNPHFRVPFLRTAVKYWPMFESMGNRYGYGGNYGESLWSGHHSVHYLLAVLGVPNKVINTPLPPGGLEELARPFLITH